MCRSSKTHKKRISALFRALALLPSVVTSRALQPSRHFSEVIFSFFSAFFVPHSWRFQRQTSLETLLRGRPYWWSLSSTKMTTGPFSKRRITREKCLRDPLQVCDIDALKGSRGERSCYWISPDSNITLAVVVLRIPALDRASVFLLVFFAFHSFRKSFASVWGLVDCLRLSLLACPHYVTWLARSVDGEEAP